MFSSQTHVGPTQSTQHRRKRAARSWRMDAENDANDANDAKLHPRSNQRDGALGAM